MFHAKYILLFLWKFFSWEVRTGFTFYFTTQFLLQVWFVCLCFIRISNLYCPCIIKHMLCQLRSRWLKHVDKKQTLKTQWQQVTQQESRFCLSVALICSSKVHPTPKINPLTFDNTLWTKERHKYLLLLKIK